MQNYNSRHIGGQAKFKINNAKDAKLKTGVFVDDANLFYAQKKAGWRVEEIVATWVEANKKTPPKNRRRLLLSILYQSQRKKSRTKKFLAEPAQAPSQARMTNKSLAKEKENVKGNLKC